MLDFKRGNTRWHIVVIFFLKKRPWTCLRTHCAMDEHVVFCVFVVVVLSVTENILTADTSTSE